MPIVSPSRQRQISVANIGADGPSGERTQFFFEQSKGIPRREDLFTVRMLEKTHPVSLPMGQIKTQVSTTPFSIRPTVDDPSSEHQMAADEIEEFLRGGYNANGDPFDHLTKQWVHDIVSIDTGIIEKVPDNDLGFLAELYNRDGATVTKNLDDHGRLPMPNDDEPAYWQFSLAGSVKPFDPNRSLRDMANEWQNIGYGLRSRDPIGFTRDQLLWTETNPAPWRVYGFGKVQQVRRVAEIVLNQDVTNLAYFSQNEVADGVVNIVEANQGEVDEFREYWKDEVKGNEHRLPIVGGDGSQIEWIPFRPTPDELQFLESQQWYNQLIWMLFGLNQGEVGDIENINRATMQEMAANVYRTLTKPLLDRLANDINRHILPYMQEYRRVNGELEFAWQTDNPAMRKEERERQRQALESGTATINEVRIERGEEPLDWGDMPLELVRSVARNHPEWALEKWGDVEDPPETAPPGGGLLGAGYGDNPSGGSEEGKAHREGSPTDDLLPSPSKQEPGSHVIPLDAVGKSDLIEALKPFGPWEDFEDCVESMMEEGYSREEAEAICGDLEQELDSYRSLLLRDSDSLRDEQWEWQFPPLASHVEGLSDRIASIIKSIEPDLEDIAAELFPEEEGDHSPAINIDSALGDIDITDELQEEIIASNLEALRVAADYHADKLESEAEKRWSQKQDEEEEVAINIEFDVGDTFAARRLETQAAARMVTVSETVKEKIRNTLVNVSDDGGNVSEATAALREDIDELSDSHSRLVARTETLTSQRHGSQALSEGTDLIAGKQWNATDDNRTRTWHSVMDGEIVPKDSAFTVPSVSDEKQPPDYPREAYVVGEDQPFNCRCAQDPVLEEDMPDDIEELAALDGVVAYRIPTDSERMREIVSEFGGNGSTLGDVIRSAMESEGSVNAACDLLGISTATIYDWGEQCGIEEFDR